MKLCWQILCTCLIFSPHRANAVAGIDVPTTPTDIPTNVSISNLLQTNPTDTTCATRAFADALAANVDKVSEQSSEIEIQQWIHSTFSKPDVLQRVIACPEIASAAPNDDIKFIPIEYTFPAVEKLSLTMKPSRVYYSNACCWRTSAAPPTTAPARVSAPSAIRQHGPTQTRHGMALWW